MAKETKALNTSPHMNGILKRLCLRQNSSWLQTNPRKCLFLGLVIHVVKRATLEVNSAGWRTKRSYLQHTGSGCARTFSLEMYDQWVGINDCSNTRREMNELLSSSGSIIYGLYWKHNFQDFSLWGQERKGLPIESQTQLFSLWPPVCVSLVFQARKRTAARFWSSATPSTAATAPSWRGSGSSRPPCSRTTRCWRWAASRRLAGAWGFCTAGTPLNTPRCCRTRASVTSSVSLAAGGSSLWIS